MLIYWLPFAAAGFLSLLRPTQARAGLAAVAVGLVVLVGLRHNVGTDWGTYASWVTDVVDAPLAKALARTDPAYGLLNWLGANGFGGIYFVTLVCAILAIVPLALFCATRKNPGLALLVAIPYLVTVVDMNYTRQSVAVGFAMLAMMSVERQRTLPFLAAVTMAALFHKAAVCLFILAPALFAGRWDRRAFRQFAFIALYALLLSGALLWRSFLPLLQQYFVRAGDQIGVVTLEREVKSGLYSGGAVFRITQTVIAAGAILVLAWRTNLRVPEKWLWAITSAAILVLFAASFFRSTFADRAALYFLPLQLHAFSALPDALPRPFGQLMHVAIVVCAGAVFWVWFRFGSDSALWLPYQSALQHWF
nr:EpsG family protein [Devosia ureilytica]